MNKDLKGISEEDLRKRKMSLSIITGFLVFVLILLVVYGVRSPTTTGSNSLIIPLALSPIVLWSFSRIGAIKKELRSRKAG